MSKVRVQLEPAWLLHHRPWSDTSRILELLTRERGRITLFAHGSRRPKSKLRGLLQPFRPLLVSWAGRADGGTLTGAEPGPGAPVLPAASVMSAFYLNELLMRLLAKEDRHERLYDAYGEALAGLQQDRVHRTLRRFEKLLLDELGYGPELAREAGEGAVLDPDRYYHFEPGRGVLAVRDSAAHPDAYRGSEVLAVSRGEFDEPRVLVAARRIYGAAIAHCLDGGDLASREVMLALRRREQEA